MEYFQFKAQTVLAISQLAALVTNHSLVLDTVPMDNNVRCSPSVAFLL